MTPEPCKVENYFLSKGFEELIYRYSGEMNKDSNLSTFFNSVIVNNICLAGKPKATIHYRIILLDRLYGAVSTILHLHILHNLFVDWRVNQTKPFSN